MKHIAFAFTVALAGCSPAAAPPAAAPAAPAAPAMAEARPAASAQQAPDDPAAVPPPPAHCALPGTAPSCATDRAATLEALAKALSAGAARDAELAALEGCAAFPRGLVRALRADLGPGECGDTLTAPLLDEQVALDASIRDVLVGLTTGARLRRLARDAPTLNQPYDKATFDRFMQGTLLHWIAAQAKAIHTLSAAGAKLEGYSKGIVAVEAGMADLRFVDIARSVQLPEDMEKDAEIREVYYSTLDAALEPRKARGRDAALVGLRRLSETGVLHDERLSHARTLLSKLYAGRRIDSLDGLLLPALPAPAKSTTLVDLARTLPTFYAGVLLGDEDPTQPELLRALLDRGIPAKHRALLESRPLPDATRRLWARALVAFAQRYWRIGDLESAARLTFVPADEAKLVGALSRALAGGPRDAAAMMLQGPLLAERVGDIAALDAVARGRGPIAAMADFDAALLSALVPRTGRDQAFWRGVAARFRRASAGLPDAAQRAEAERRAADADATSAAAE